MRKLLILGLAAVLVFAFTLPASALENKFGGYWRTRMFGNANFAGETNKTVATGIDPLSGNPTFPDAEDQDLWNVDTRTRLYYTAILNENLQFVTKFEFDTAWGTEPLGDFGADGKELEIKNAYADFNVGPLEAKVGIQGAALGRSFVFDNDFSGLQLVYRASEAFWLRGTWLKEFEGGTGKDANDYDIDAYALEAGIQLGEVGFIQPYVIWRYSDDAQLFESDAPDCAAVDDSVFPAACIPEVASISDADEQSIYWIGVDANFTLGPAGIWASASYVTGDLDSKTPNADEDLSGYLFALGANMPVGPMGIHGQFFWASGDDDPLDDDIDQFVGLGESYYWAEILGYGTFDQQLPAGSPGDSISNIWALNIGASLKPVEKLTLRGDIWYAQLVEKEQGPGATAANNFDGEDDLGVEVDLKATYQLIEGLNLDLIGAYLFAGDAISTTGDNDDDPYEVGAQLSLSF
jgi:hypothetical protein